MIDLATTLDIILTEENKLPEPLKTLQPSIHSKLDLPSSNPEHRLNKEEVFALLSWLMDEPVQKNNYNLNYKLADYVLKVYFVGNSAEKGK